MPRGIPKVKKALRIYVEPLMEDQIKLIQARQEMAGFWVNCLHHTPATLMAMPLRQLMAIKKRYADKLEQYNKSQLKRSSQQ